MAWSCVPVWVLVICVLPSRAGKECPLERSVGPHRKRCPPCLGDMAQNKMRGRHRGAMHQVQVAKAGLGAVVEPLARLSPKPLPRRTLLLCDPKSGSPAIRAPVAVRAAQGLSCPPLGHAVPMIILTLSAGLRPGFLRPPAKAAGHLLSSDGRTVGLAARSQASLQ